MAKNTINYNFTLPDKAEAYAINIVNSNTTKIDAQIKSNEDKIKEVENSLDKLELKDTAIDVVAEEKKLNVVLSELRKRDKDIGTLSELKTTEKKNVVLAINENHTNMNEIITLFHNNNERHKSANTVILSKL